MGNFETTLNPFSGKLQKITKESVVENLQNNNVINAFDIANIGEKVMYQMDDQIIEDYQDLSGIDAGNSSGYQHDAVNDLIEPLEQTSTKLLLHLDGTEGQTTTIDATGNHIITLHGTAQLDTAYKKWGTASLLLDGNSDYLTIPDSSDWDWFVNNVDDWTVDFWVRHDVLGNSEQYWHQSSDWNNYLAISKPANNSVAASLVTGGVGRLSISGGTINDTNFHHVAMIKIGANIAMYLDGNQVAYGTSTVWLGISGIANIGAYNIAGGQGQYVDGHIDEFRAIKHNYFSASPNVGLTDTITVPTEAYSLATPDVIIQSIVFTADIAPSELSIIMREEDVDAITLNTDLQIFGSRDAGTTWTQGTLEELGDQVGSQRNLKANIGVAEQPSGTSVKYRYKSSGKNLKFHAISESWKT